MERNSVLSSIVKAEKSQAMQGKKRIQSTRDKHYNLDKTEDKSDWRYVTTRQYTTGFAPLEWQDTAFRLWDLSARYFFHSA